MANENAVSFLHEISLGTIPNPDDLDQNIVSVTSTAAGDFDPGFLFTDTLRQTWRSTDTAQQEIVFKADSAVRVDTFAILGHNFSELAVVTFEANSSSDFTTPAISINIPWQFGNMVLLQDLGFDFEFYKLTILDPTNECGFIEIGRLAGGQAFSFQDEENIEDNFSIRYSDQSTQLRTEGFNRPSNQSIYIREVEANFAKMSTKPGQSDNYEGLIDMIDNVRTTRPFLTILDRGAPDLFTGWVVFKTLPSFQFSVNNFVEANLSIEEVF